MFSLLFILIVSVSGQVRHCRLDPHPSVEYRCVVSGVVEGTRACGAAEPPGTVVRPLCRSPNYYSTTSLAPMHCFDGGYWDYIARCIPECGRVTPDGKGLVVGGKRVKRGELPWHAGIYKTTTRPYKQICGGSLISINVVLSVAHCFWNDTHKQLPASQFAVAIGKIFRPWEDNMDMAQKSPVKVIHLPERYQGPGANFQDDIAIVIVAKEFTLKSHIRPVCLSFDYQFELQQLSPGAVGKVAGWGLTAADGKSSPVLQVLDLPYVDVGTCIRNSRPDYREYITSDKICAGTLDSSMALCEGDSGGGLAFPEQIQGVQRYYLRGLVSSAPTSLDGHLCNTESYTSFTSTLRHEHFIKEFWIELGEFKCKDGSYITAVSHCDGVRHCADGSDETAAACAKKTCPSYLFQCAYGACVDKGATCNGVADCADGSDETDRLCVTATALLSINEPKPGVCILPAYPAHGSYASNIAGAKPGQGYERVSITNVTCDRGYGLSGPTPEQYYCYNGTWTEVIPKCVRMCELASSTSVDYTCLDSYGGDARPCNTYEPIGTLVSPQCRRPNYYSANSLPYMRCADGEWDNVAKCIAECGRVTPSAMLLVAGGQPARRGELPWMAAVYDKTLSPYMQICAGSLIRNDVILAVAHCFYDGETSKTLPASRYAVAVGKLYRPWSYPKDDGAQKSDVKQIHIPPRFSGSQANFQDDIAVLIVSEPFEYKPFIRPVCVDFDINFDQRQLRPGNKGKVAGWGLTSRNGKPSPTLQVVELPYVDVATCISDYPPSFHEFTTSDKICAGTLTNDTALCRGDTGGGLCFPAVDRTGVERYYLRGIVSAAPIVDPEALCTLETYASFTHVQKHEGFIRQYVNDL